MKTEKAMFGAGCFWGLQYIFQRVPGVVKTSVGYSGGNITNPSYEEVCSDESGHVEVVYIEFNSEIVSYSDLLSVFWKSHDPTTKDMQWPDVGSQYRSVVFYYNETQKKQAVDSLKRIQKLIPKKIVTEISKASKFYPAENYHQDYVKKHGVNSCHIGRNPNLS